VTQKHVHQIDTQRANLTSAAASLVLQAKTMLFDPKEFLVEREDCGRLDIAGRRELALSMRENFFEVSRHVDFRADFGSSTGGR
jgi:hypothetical protein